MLSSLSFAILSDTHIGPSEQFELQGIRPAERARKIVAAIQQLVQPPSFVVHLGDIVADPNPDSYARAVEILSPLQPPLRCIAGNHDSAAFVGTSFPVKNAPHFSPGPTAASYSFTEGGHRFIALDARESKAPWNGRLADGQLAFLKGEIASSPSSVTVLLHYPARSLHVPWVDRRMMLEDGDELHKTLTSLPLGTVRGVFSGHVHRAIGVLDSGIIYQSVPATSVSMNIQPGVEEPSFAPEPAPMFTLVRFEGSQTIISHHQA